METTNIYTLTDPRTNEVRYVGKANNVSQRYQAHLNRARDHQTHKRNWINSLRILGLKPILEIIDVVPINEWVFWETYWVGQMKAWGCDLTNNTLGGDGCTFGNQTSFKKGQGGKKVVGYNSECEKIYEFDSMRQGEEFIKSRSMWGVLIGKRKTCKNLAWFYSEDLNKLLESEVRLLIKSKFYKTKRTINTGNFVSGQKSKRSKKVIVSNVKTGESEIFESGRFFADKIGVNQSAISWAIKNNKIIKKTYKISFKNG
jgi:hypothetical protein